MIAITPLIFFPRRKPKNRPPHFPARTSSPPKIVSDQISVDGAWMNFRFSRALPPGGLAHAGTRGIPSDGRCRAGPLIWLGRAGDACVVGALERVGDSLYGARVYVKLGR